MSIELKTSWNNAFFCKVLLSSFLLISLTGYAKEKVDQKQKQSQNTEISTVTTPDATNSKLPNSSHPEKQSVPKKSIITSVSGIEFGSKPRGNEKFISPAKNIYEQKGQYLYSYEECIKVNGYLLTWVTVNYTPITKQLFSVHANISYHDLSKFAELISTKYNVDLRLSNTHYNDNGNAYTRGIIEQDYRSGIITIGDVTISLSGNREIIHWDASDLSRTRERKSKGEIKYVNIRLYDLYVEETAKCSQKLAADAAKKKADEARRKLEKQRQIEKQKQREREMGDL
mgnify:CR=1 FL=1